MAQCGEPRAALKGALRAGGGSASLAQRRITMRYRRGRTRLVVWINQKGDRKYDIFYPKYRGYNQLVKQKQLNSIGVRPMGKSLRKTSKTHRKTNNGQDYGILHLQMKGFESEYEEFRISYAARPGICSKMDFNPLHEDHTRFR